MREQYTSSTNYAQADLLQNILHLPVKIYTSDKQYDWLASSHNMSYMMYTETNTNGKALL